MTKILDCTLRDGGYYTNWDFDTPIVDSYLEAINNLPIDYIEIGYRNNPSKEYLGKFGYTPVSILKQIRENCNKKIAVMLNEKSTAPDDLERLIVPIKGLADMIRLAIDPANFDRAVVLAKHIKELGFEVGFNCMYMSKWSSDYPGFLSKLGQLNGVCDLFCMVDSFGGITPSGVQSIYKEVRKNTIIPVGFHGHNNLELGLINTVTAINLGIDYVDTTVLGMGRGAGNLKTELLLTYLNANSNLPVDFNVLGNVISSFTPLLDKYHWGTNLPYMIAGANKIPQKVVMDWVTNRVYSFNSVVRALENKKMNIKDNAKYPEFAVTKRYKKVLVIGGGSSINSHLDGIKEFASKDPETALVFVTARHADLFKDVMNPKFYTLVGTEGKRLSRKVKNGIFNATVILPPYPRTMGTDVPDFVKSSTFELPEIEFVHGYPDSSTAISLQLALNLSDSEIFVAGYDGYPGSILSEKETELSRENRDLFTAYQNYTGKSLLSLTPSIYRELETKSVYQYL